MGNSYAVEVWDAQALQKLRIIEGHLGPVPSLSWNGHCLTTGGKDSEIVHHDLRIRNSAVARCLGHEDGILQLKWNKDGSMLASGDFDGLLCLWDLRMSAGRNPWVEPRLKFREHKSAVKAIDWNPHRRGLLASGGGINDKTIKIVHSPSPSDLQVR